MNVTQEGWQERMWHFYDNLGSVHYGVQFKKNAASKVAYFAAEINVDDPDQGPQQTTNPIVEAAVDRLHSGYGDINEIVAELMIHINVPGEGYLVGRDGLDGEEWDVWSVDEVRASQFAAFLQLEPDRVTADSGVFACRIWRPHPRNRHLADAPLRPVADQCEQLLLLEDSISAAAKSRLSAGFLLVPSEMDIGEQSAFEDNLIAILTTPIRETDSAARWAPGLIRGAAEHLDQIRMLPFSREIDGTFAGMREELTRAIAAGLDLPAEIILGKGDLNHWTGWDIDESAFRDHIDPDIILILDSITRGYLHPALEEAGVPDFERYLIWRDLSDLGQQPPTIAEALEMQAAGVVDDQYVRDLAGVADDYIPEEPPTPAPAVELPMPISQGPPVQQDQLVAALQTKPLTELARIDQGLLERISEATEAAFNRVLERAGAKIRSHARKDRAITMSIDQLANDQVTRHLGEKLIMQLQITPGELVPPDSFDPLQKRLRAMMNGAADAVAAELETLTGAAINTLSIPKIEAAIGHYVTQLEGYALRLLFNPIEPGPGEVGASEVPARFVMDMLTEAGGGVPTVGPSDVRGFATGRDSLEFLQQNGYGLAGHRWDYGDAGTRRRPFRPHRLLDGQEFSDWTDDLLTTPASASFLNVGHMFPGDHFRCQCQTVPVVIIPQAAAA